MSDTDPQPEWLPNPEVPAHGTNAARVLSGLATTALVVGSVYWALNHVWGGSNPGDLDTIKPDGVEPSQSAERVLSSEEFKSINNYAKRVGRKVFRCLEPVDEVDAAQDLPETALRFGNSGKSCFRWTSGNITATYAPHTHDDTADVIIQNTDSPDRSSQTQYTLVFTGPYDGGTAKSEADVVDFMNLETTQLTSAKQVEDVYRSSMTTEARVGDVGGDGSVSLSSRFILIARGLDDRFERTVSPSTPVPDTCNIISKITEDLYVGIGSKTCRAG